ncbi:pyruvate kinase [Heliobacterium gestii]|uniref:Pyruvate kinase n=1 Tax=Heliomicrobium gestii TaxID=2699 RepID=A0A845L9I2_HELGE|nr:pyruvate kinase [Heliomicrobium gestii]MBM7866347.1 pyruvate kinase [Heliomicrobium gestii]MZP42868.1 pyruvate kinase [Heliomicrobium gestii]
MASILRPPTPHHRDWLADQLAAFYAVITDHALSVAQAFPLQTPEGRLSRDNLLAYLAMRRHDIVDLQIALADYGLSSLGRLEATVLSGLERVLAHLGLEAAPTGLARPDSEQARFLTQTRSRRLLGRPRDKRDTRIMVTLDAACIHRQELLEELLLNGMDLARINCAHDSPPEWKQLIAAIRQAEDSLEQRGEGAGRRCRILMDLGGPKIRTGPLMEETRPLKLAAPRDPFGSPYRLLEGYLDGEALFTQRIAEPEGRARFVIALPRQIGLDRLRVGRQLQFQDTRDRLRTLHVLERVSATRVRVGLDRTAYLQGGIVLAGEKDAAFTVGPILPQPVVVEVRQGDTLRIYRNPLQMGHPASADSPAGISCTLPAALDFVQPDQRVYIDDGKIGAVARAVTAEYLELEVLVTAGPSARIKPEKGLNFPDSRLELPALTEQDRQDLRVVAKHADAVGLSFVHSPKDLLDLQTALQELGRPDMGVIAKIETSEAIHRLAHLLITGLTFPSFGVMIARGDLAVEVGFENLALVQEDILCMCEAAHTPVIWATQVLETLAKTGLPARAEITDAAMGHRADCVMLNKGPHILEAVKTLSTLLCAEERCHLKKRQIFREFTAQHGIFEET